MAEIRINATGGVKLYDADDSHYAQIVAGTITSNTDVMTLGHAAVVMGTKLDMNGSNLILDADADTYLDTGTDDTIKVYVSGAHDLTIGANAINVLSGTTLTIDSGATITNSGTANGFGALAGIDDQTSSNDDQLTITDTAVIINEDSDDLDFRVESNGNANMLFVSGGNDVVGIGNEGDLGVGLHVKSADSGADVSGSADEIIAEGSGDAGLSILTGTSSSGYVMFGDSGDNDIGKIQYNHDNNGMFFFTNATQQMAILSSGLTGIGDANPAAQLSVKRDSATAWAGHIENEASSNYGRVLQLKLDNDFDDTSSVFMIAYGASNERFKVFSDGDCQNADNSYGAISDERIKQNITDASSQWDDIKALKVRNFKRKDDVRKYGDAAWEQIGLVAQEAELVSPKLIIESLPSSSDILSDSAFGTLYEEGDVIPEDKKIGDVKTMTSERVKGMKYSVLYMKAIKALQEAQTRIETLEAKVAVLEG